MGKKILLLFIVVCCQIIPVKAQLTIEECYERARANYPMIKRHQLIARTGQYSVSNAGKGYLPQLGLSGKATYQSDVTSIDIDIPGVDIPSLSKDQYNAALELNQLIWDGGAITANKNLIRSNTVVEQLQLESDLYAINERVNQLYFGILLLDARLEQNAVFQRELDRNYNLIRSYMENGIANQTDLDAIRVEKLKSVQTEMTLSTNRMAYLEMLSILIDEKLPSSTVLLYPDAEIAIASLENRRPEIALFQAQINSLDVRKQLIRANNMPKVGFFLTGGWGRPGLNMLDNDFAPYYMTGLKLSWNFGNLYTNRNDRRIIETNQQSIRVQEEAFRFNSTLETTQEMKDIYKNRELLRYDDEIIQLRKNVREAAEVKVANGIITVSDLMQELHNEESAIQDKILHEIELLSAVYSLKYTTNN